MTTAITATRSTVIASCWDGKRSRSMEPIVGVAAAEAPCPRPSGNNTVSSTNALQSQSANGTVRVAATSPAVMTNRRRSGPGGIADTRNGRTRIEVCFIASASPPESPARRRSASLRQDERDEQECHHRDVDPAGGEEERPRRKGEQHLEGPDLGIGRRLHPAEAGDRDREGDDREPHACVRPDDMARQRPRETEHEHPRQVWEVDLGRERSIRERAVSILGHVGVLPVERDVRRLLDDDHFGLGVISRVTLGPPDGSGHEGDDRRREEDDDDEPDPTPALTGLVPGQPRGTDGQDGGHPVRPQRHPPPGPLQRDVGGRGRDAGERRRDPVQESVHEPWPSGWGDRHRAPR